jgi:hypothetical protein
MRQKIIFEVSVPQNGIRVQKAKRCPPLNAFVRIQSVAVKKIMNTDCLRWISWILNDIM